MLFRLSVIDNHQIVQNVLCMPSLLNIFKKQMQIYEICHKFINFALPLPLEFIRFSQKRT